MLLGHLDTRKGDSTTLAKYGYDLEALLFVFKALHGLLSQYTTKLLCYQLRSIYQMLLAVP